MKMKYMDDCILLISLSVALGSMVAVFFIYLHYLRMKREYNRTIMKNIHEQDHITQELERTRVEKEEMERVLKTELLKAVETSAEEADADKHMASYGRKHILRIDITYLV